MVRIDSNALALVRLLPYGQWNLAGGREVLDALLGLGERAVGALGATLVDSRQPRFLRLASAWTLGRIGSVRARESLRQAARDDDVDVASEVARALGLAAGPRWTGRTAAA